MSFLFPSLLCTFHKPPQVVAEARVKINPLFNPRKTNSAVLVFLQKVQALPVAVSSLSSPVSAAVRWWTHHIFSSKLREFDCRFNRHKKPEYLIGVYSSRGFRLCPHLIQDLSANKCKQGRLLMHLSMYRYSHWLLVFIPPEYISSKTLKAKIFVRHLHMKFSGTQPRGEDWCYFVD